LRECAPRIDLPPEVQPKPSIAVLPFANLSSAPDDEYFSDGLADEIISALAKVPGLEVIARTSSFAFKGQRVDIRQIARPSASRSCSKAASAVPAVASASPRSS
jgi:TolB-like protein